MKGESADVRLLSVHLKSSCFANYHDRRNRYTCPRLKTQIPSLEDWLDRQSRDGAAAIALGDFNRRFTEPGDNVWSDLDDGDPGDYGTLMEGHRQACKGRYEGDHYIDHIVVNEAAEPLVRPDLLPLVYNETVDAAPSDHCPVAVRLNLDEDS